MALDLNKIKRYAKVKSEITEEEYRETYSTLMKDHSEGYVNSVLITGQKDGKAQRYQVSTPDENELELALLYRVNKKQEDILKEISELKSEQAKISETLLSIKAMLKFFTILAIISLIITFVFGFKFIDLFKY